MYGAVVCVEAEVTGDVKIGTKTIIHPCAKIVGKNGPIIIGDSNIIEELVTIVNLSNREMVIGNNNVFEVGATVLARAVGDSNVFETKCFVGEDIVVGNGSTFGAGTNVGNRKEEMKDDEEDVEGLKLQETSIPDNSVFYGSPLRHRISAERPSPQSQQIEFLAKMLPNYHHIKLYTTKEKEGN